MGSLIKSVKEKMPVKKCKEILCKNGANYSDAEIISIRDFLYQLAEIDYAVFIHSERKAEPGKIIQLEINEQQQIEQKNSKLKDAA